LFVVIISVGSNAVAAYTGNNHACLRHKCFTDNDRDQQTYGSDRSGPGVSFGKRSLIKGRLLYNGNSIGKMGRKDLIRERLLYNGNSI
jgi:hypothetical protein